jgi:hypothetical protein
MLNAQEKNHIAGIVITTLTDKGVCNMQELCRAVNNRDFKFCHKVHDKWKHIDKRVDNQFVKQCNDCNYHYRDVYKVIMNLDKEGKIKTEKRMYRDRKNDEGDLYPKKRDTFRFCFLDYDIYHKKILINTLDGW